MARTTSRITPRRREAWFRVRRSMAHLISTRTPVRGRGRRRPDEWASSGLHVLDNGDLPRLLTLGLPDADCDLNRGDRKCVSRGRDRRIEVRSLESGCTGVEVFREWDRVRLN